jgi:dipeptidyl aminopeptidase/acylaminoacyl peptidase
VPRQLYYIGNSGAPDFHTTLYGAATDGSLPLPLVVDTLADGAWLQDWFRPWVSRDGREIKVLVWRSDVGLAIATLDPLGAPLDRTPYPRGAPTCCGYWGSEISPDGTHLVWIDRWSSGVPSIQVADLGGGSVQRFRLDTLTDASSDVAWSSDGRSIAYVAWRPTQVSPYVTDVRLIIRRLSDGFTRPVAVLAGSGAAPAWSHDGRWLTVTVGGDIHRVRADGSGSVKVLYNGGQAEALYAAWAPGDSLVAVLTVSGVVFLHPDGGGARPLVTEDLVVGFGWMH